LVVVSTKNLTVDGKYWVLDNYSARRGYVSIMTPPAVGSWHPSPYAGKRLEPMCPQARETPISGTRASPESETRTAIALMKRGSNGNWF